MASPACRKRVGAAAPLVVVVFCVFSPDGGSLLQRSALVRIDARPRPSDPETNASADCGSRGTTFPTPGDISNNILRLLDQYSYHRFPGTATTPDNRGTATWSARFSARSAPPSSRPCRALRWKPMPSISGRAFLKAWNLRPSSRRRSKRCAPGRINIRRGRSYNPRWRAAWFGGGVGCILNHRVFPTDVAFAPGISRRPVVHRSRSSD